MLGQHSEYQFLSHRTEAWKSILCSALGSFAKRLLVYFLLFGGYFMVDGGIFILTRGRSLIIRYIPKAYLFLSCLKLEMPFPYQKKKKKVMNYD